MTQYPLMNPLISMHCIGQKKQYFTAQYYFIWDACLKAFAIPTT